MHGALELSKIGMSAKLTASAKGGQWNHLHDASWTGRGIGVQKTFEVTEETSSDTSLVKGDKAAMT